MANSEGIEIPAGAQFRITVWDALTDELSIVGYADTYPRAKDMTIGIRLSSNYSQIDITELNNPENDDLVIVG